MLGGTHIVESPYVNEVYTLDISSGAEGNSTSGAAVKSIVMLFVCLDICPTLEEAMLSGGQGGTGDNGTGAEGG
jgi:hypothetical protein